MNLAQSIPCLDKTDPRSASTAIGQRAEAARVVFQQAENESVRVFDAIADKIEREPRLLTIPLNNIARWLGKGHPSVARLTAWKTKIETATHSSGEFSALLFLLRDPSQEAMRWKGFSPFAGVLTPDELDAL